MPLETGDTLNNFWYFFSTAPQVLGAILAVSGAFVVFWVDRLKREIVEDIKELLGIWKDRGIGLSEEKELMYAMNVNDFDRVVSSGLPKVDYNVEEDDIDGLKLYCRIIVTKVRYLNTFLSRTKRYFILNGIILGLLMVTFIIIPNIVLDSQINDVDGLDESIANISINVLNIIVLCGWGITILALFLIIKYLILALNIKPLPVYTKNAPIIRMKRKLQRIETWVINGTEKALKQLLSIFKRKRPRNCKSPDPTPPNHSLPT